MKAKPRIKNMYHTYFFFLYSVRFWVKWNHIVLLLVQKSVTFLSLFLFLCFSLVESTTVWHRHPCKTLYFPCLLDIVRAQSIFDQIKLNQWSMDQKSANLQLFFGHVEKPRLPCSQRNKKRILFVFFISSSRLLYNNSLYWLPQ